MVICNILWRLLGVMLWILGTCAIDNVKEKEQNMKNQFPNDLSNVKETTFSGIGLEERKRVNASRVHIPPYMLHLYSLQMSRNRQMYEENTNSVSEDQPELPVDTVRSYVWKEDEMNYFMPTRTMLLQFNISKFPDDEIIRAVELRISHDAHSSSAAQFPFMVKRSQFQNRKLTKKDIKYLQRLRIYDILRPSRDENGPIHRFLDTTVVDIRTSGTVKFDVSPAIKRWTNNLNKNYGLFLEITPLQKEIGHKRAHLHIRLKRNAPLSQYLLEQQEPLLLIYSDDGTSKNRIKRESKSSFKRHGQECQRHSLSVDFRKVEWTNWIVAPAGYDAYYCQGECDFPLGEHMNTTNHGVIQTLVHSRYPSRVPSACCVPTMHTAISMLYVDEDERVVLKNYQDMVVEGCGCR